MTKDKKSEETNEPQQNGRLEMQPPAPLVVHAQYVKDVSFENPLAPETLKPNRPGTPEINVNVNMDAQKIEEEGHALYEVSLRLAATAKREDKTDFIVEITYAILAEVDAQVPEAHHHPILLIEGPKLAFPFARQLLANLVQQGGYPPLLLNPVDFEGLYKKQYAEAIKQQKAAQN